MQSTPSETSTAGIADSTKMDADRQDSDSLKNGIEQTEAPIDQEETPHLAESKVLLNGSAHKEPAECDSHELENNVIHENNVNGDPLVDNSVNDINVDKETDPLNESNKDEKVLPTEPEESSAENTVSNEEPKSSLEETASLKPEVTEEPKPEETPEAQSSVEATAPLKPEETQATQSSVEETAPSKLEETPEPKSSVAETAPSKPEETQEAKSSAEETVPLKAEETAPSKPEETPEPKSSVAEEETQQAKSSAEETAPLKPEETAPSKPEETAPSKPEETSEPKYSVENTAPLKPQRTPEPKSSLGETAPLKPEVIQEAVSTNPFEEEEPEGPMDILGNGLLLKTVLKEGKGRQSRPTHGKRVVLKTEGKLENGTIVDRNESVEFIVGDGDVISAWDITVALMGENEIAELKCDPKYAYGSVGRVPDVPANAQITYTLEFLSQENGPDYNFISIDERMYHGSQKKERGNYLFSRCDYRSAINSYLKAISIIDNDSVSFEEPPQKLQQLLEDKIKCYNNLAAAQLKVDYYDAAITSCEGVLKHHPENVKALFRMGKAYAAKGETKDAITHMKKALKLEPETKIIHQELSKLTKKLHKETQSERNMYKKMFRTNNETPVKPSVEQSRWKWPVLAGSLAVVLLSVGVAYFRYRQH